MSQSIYNAFLLIKRQHTKGKTTGAEMDVLQAESDETQAVEGAVTDTPRKRHRRIDPKRRQAFNLRTGGKKAGTTGNGLPACIQNTNPGFHPTDSCGQFPFQKPFSDRFL